MPEYVAPTNTDVNFGLEEYDKPVSTNTNFDFSSQTVTLESELVFETSITESAQAFESASVGLVFESDATESARDFELVYGETLGFAEKDTTTLANAEKDTILLGSAEID